MATFQYHAAVAPFSTGVGNDSWSLTQLNSTTAVWQSGDLRFVLTGSGLSAGPPATGTLTGMKLYQAGMGVGGAGEVLIGASTAGLSLPFAGLVQALADDDSAFALPTYLFKGNDSVGGSAGGDDLFGYGGNDTINGAAGNDYLYGDSYEFDVTPGNDSLSGGDGNDTLDGAGGNDTMNGGSGDDLYAVTEAGDRVVESSAGGGAYDRVEFSNGAGLASYTLPVNVENLDVLNSAYPSSNTPMTATGNDGANRIAVLDAYGSRTLGMKLYGKGGNDRLTALDGSDTLDGGSGDDTMIGGRGSDTYYVNSVKDAVLEEISLTGPSPDVDTVQCDVGSAGTVSLGGTVSGLTNTISYSGVENLRLGTSSATVAHKGIGNSAANGLTGNAGANKLYGLGGADTLNGGGGADTLVGGAGNDSYTVDHVSDLVSELSGEGTDRVNASLSLTLAANVEHLTLTGSAALKGTGNGGANAITGNAGANLLTGLDGSDTLDGGGGADTLVGGIGNDSYAVNQSSDVITEVAGEGTDTVLSSTSWTLGSTLEHLTLTGSAAINGKGNGAANRIIGNAADNTLTGLDGKDTLDGGGGFNTLVGGLGNDSYLNVGWDTVTELASQGTDTVLLDKSFYTSAYVLPVNVENATKAIDSADDYGLTGNDSANVLTGSALDEQLYGGLGNDTLVGHGGSDRYNLDNPGDVVVEAAGEGASDTVWAAFTITLAANVENLYLTDYDGRANTHGTGNSSDNHIFGDDGDNLLNGAGGNDRLEGGYGNDTYVVDSAGDTVIENGFYGVDTVKSSVAFTLGSYVENLTLTGSGNIDGTGNNLANKIIANSGANKLNGGFGADTMTGGAGNDTYWYDDFGDDGIELPNQGTDTLVCQLSDVEVTLDENFENLTMTGSRLQIANGNVANNVLIGSADASSNQLRGGAGNDKLTGGAGTTNYFMLDSLVGSDTITNFRPATDGLRILQSGIAVGDGDELVDGAVQVSGPGGFAASAEIVVVTGNIAGTITTSSAAAKIGSASSAYAVGRKAVFAVDNGEDLALYLFTAVDANATVSAAELKLLVLLDGTSSITTADLWFGA